MKHLVIVLVDEDKVPDDHARKAYLPSEANSPVGTTCHLETDTGYSTHDNAKIVGWVPFVVPVAALYCICPDGGWNSACPAHKDDANPFPFGGAR